MAKKPVRKRKAARTKPTSKPAYVKTGRVLKAMQKVLNDLDEKRRGETGWTVFETLKVEAAMGQLQKLMKKMDCTPSQSYPRP